MIGAGHMSDYLLTSRNLYRHSQQGWENLNHLLKTFFFRCTARGGAGNAGLGSKNRLLPIAKWLQRRLVFSCGFQHEDILKYISNKNSQHVDEQDSSDVHDVL